MSGNLTVSARYEIGEYNYGAYSTKVSTSRVFDGDVSVALLNGIEIIYQDGRDSLRFGDSYVVVRGQTEYGEDYERNFPVSVLKATPEYTVPEGLSAKKGQILSEIELPSGFSWMEPETELDELGETAFKVRFTPDDTNNYETVENIDVIVTVLSATLVDIRTPNDVDVSANGETLTLVSDKPTLIIGLINDGWVLVEVDSNANNDGVMTNIYNISGYDEVKVVLKGDGNMDGAVSTADSNLINKSLISSSLPPYRALTDIERLILDLDGDNAISTGDSNIINKSLISPSLPPYRAIRW
jgi:hypothetical protein